MLSDREKFARLERALQWAGPTHRVSDVVERIKDNKAKFYTNGPGVIVAEMEQYPLVKVVRFWLIAGELKACLALEDEVLADGLAHGCEVAVAAGRRGWGKVAAPTGWRLHSWNFAKPLTRDFWRPGCEGSA